MHVVDEPGSVVSADLTLCDTDLADRLADAHGNTASSFIDGHEIHHPNARTGATLLGFALGAEVMTGSSLATALL